MSAGDMENGGAVETSRLSRTASNALAAHKLYSAGQTNSRKPAAILRILMHRSGELGVIHARCWVNHSPLVAHILKKRHDRISAPLP